MAVRRRSPQEKKRLSYSKDRRNAYGENDKSSRKNIARNKRFRHRSGRHRQHQELTAAIGPVDPEAESLIGEHVTRPRRGSRWRKFPDMQLGLFIASTLEHRASKGMSSQQTGLGRAVRVRRGTATDPAVRRRKW